MIYVVLCAGKRTDALVSLVVSSLKKYGGVQCITKSKIFGTNDVSPTFCVVTADTVPALSGVNRGIIVIDDHAVYSEKCKKLHTDCLCIVSSNNKKALNMLCNTNTPVITCGSGSKDTFSMASVQDTCATISLQRDITDVYGNVVEPMDINVKFKEGSSISSVLFACAVFTLCGIDPNEYCNIT